MRGIVKRFGPTEALGGVDLVVAPGEIHALLGQNGAGKSTLMKVLSGSLAPDRGSIELDGIPFSPQNPLGSREAGIAMIYQELALAPDLSVADNIFLGFELTRRGLLDRSAMATRARVALEALGHQDIDPRAVVRRLPIATRQIVEIARALVAGSRVIVLDEPTSSLGRPDAERLFATMHRLAEQGTAIVYITHFIEEALAVADRYSVIRDGRLIETGTTATASIATIVAAMVGQSESLAYPRSSRRAGEPLLVIEGVTGREKPVQANLTLHRGEVVGIFGLVGSGRTELVRAIFGLDPVVAGTVAVAGIATPATPEDRWSRGVGMVSEDRQGEGLAVGMSVADNLMLSRMAPSPLSLVTATRQRQEVSPWIDRLGIRAAGPFQRVRDLSGGNQQKVALARLLHHGVDVWLLDEPTRGIDVASKQEIYRLIDQLVTQPDRPKAVLVIGSYLPELIGICDRIAVMRRGVLGPAVETRTTDQEALLLAATGGTTH